jgi:hypothetical protein
MLKEKNKTETILSTMWIFVSLNYLYCDVFTLFHAKTLNQLLTGTIDRIEITESFLLSFSIVMELVIAMVVLSRTLKYKANRLMNILIGALMTFIQAGTLLIGEQTIHYMFFSIIEIAATAFITLYAIRWKEPGLLTD